MDTNYKLVNSVDPSKCQPKIREKFAKLTLSSNKKKQMDAAVAQQIRDEARLSNVSRNLLNELLTDDECDESEKPPSKRTENLLVRTDSSPSNEVQPAQRPLLDYSNSTHCSELEKSSESYEGMEPLRVSEMGPTEPHRHVDDTIEQLSSRISLMAVASAPITITSGEESHGVIEIVSTENQKMDCGQGLPGVLVAEPARQPEVSICISSSSNGEEDTPITITDSENEFDPFNVSKSATSLPSTQEDAKHLRMAAFLNDVRQYCRAQETVVDREKEIALADTESMTTENFSIDTPKVATPRNNTPGPEPEARNRQREIANADTEPVTTENASISITVAKRIATADTISMTMEDRSPVKSIPDIPERNFALDDTVDVTRANETAQSSPRYAPVMNVGPEILDDSLQKLSGSLPDDSLTVAETSEELIEEEEQQHKSEAPAEDQLRPSESLSEVTSKNSSVSSTQLKINISAKINIKIQVSHGMNASVSQQSTESSEDEHPPHSSAQKAQIQPNPFEIIQPNSPPERDVYSQSTELTENSDDFTETAQRILSEVYGDTWKTPEVLRTLKKVAATSSRKARILRPKRLDVEQYCKDESALDDFSIFRRDIPQDLDSTRLPATPLTTYKNPKAESAALRQRSREMNANTRNEGKEPWRAVVDSDTEPETSGLAEVPDRDSSKSPQTADSKTDICDGMAYLDLTKDEAHDDDALSDNEGKLENVEKSKVPSTPSNTFKVPKVAATDSKVFRQRQPIADRLLPLATPQADITTKSGRRVRPRWNAIIDSDSESEGENASDDQDKSWIKTDDDDDDDDGGNVSQKQSSPPKPNCNRNVSRSRKRNDLVYLDLSKDEVEVQDDVPESPPANHDEKFNRRLEEILKTCKAPDKPKIDGTPNTKTKRKLFTAALNDNDENTPPPFDSPRERLQAIDHDERTISISGVPMPARFEPFNKHLESVKLGKPIFKIQTPKANRDTDMPKTPKSIPREINDLCTTPRDKYGFLQSLDVCVGKSLAHPAALYYKENFRQRKEELAQRLYELYNKNCFDEKLDVSINWNKKLTNTAGRCINRKRLGERTCSIELSEKVITSPDRLRCTLIHELCHAASWIFNGEGGHGATWKTWARKANQVFPELPKITVCHQYQIEYKYTYKCTLCGAKSHAHSKSKKVENIRCSYCHGAIEVYLNRKDKEGNIMLTPVREPTGFAKFVKDKYREYKRPDLKHAEVMKLLSAEFASIKVDEKA